MVGVFFLEITSKFLKCSPPFRISNRLYWFPLKQVYVASVYVEEQAIQVPFITLLVGMLWIILLMNFYWFSVSSLSTLVKHTQTKFANLFA